MSLITGLYDMGSSPLTRGKHFLRAIFRTHTLAHPRSRGENFAAGVVALAVALAHPRSRGENGPPLCEYWPTMGSSPLTRGKQGASPAPVCNSGLIPAHAGKTAPLRRVYWSMEAHPRSRGEN